MIWDDQNKLLGKRLRVARIDLRLDDLFLAPVKNTGAGWHFPHLVMERLPFKKFL